MSLQILPSPYEMTGGGNPYYAASSNIAGFAENPYDQYLSKPLELGESGYTTLLSDNWTTAVASAAYLYVRSNKQWLGALAAFFAGVYLPRITAIVLAADAVVQANVVVPEGIPNIRALIN